MMHDAPKPTELYLDLMEKCLTGLIHEDPNQSPWMSREFNLAARELGRDWPIIAHSMIGRTRMSHLRRSAEFVLQNGIPGDFVETGVWRGGACIMMRAVLKAYGATDRRVWAADSFCGLPLPDTQKYPQDTNDQHYKFPELSVPLEEVQSNFAKYDLLDDRVQFLKGWFKDTLPTAPIEQLAILRLDGDMYGSTMEALLALFDKVSPGGFVIVDDFGNVPGCRQATLEFRTSRAIRDPIYNIDGFGVFWRKS
jgi:hypothetical protein